MPLYNTKQRTIYNGNTAKDRFKQVQPSLGMATALRNKDTKQTDLPRANEETNPLKLIRSRRDESLLKIHAITRGCTDVLFQTKTVWPFDLFPDVLIISATKIEIIINSFFNSYSTVTIPLQDIGHVEINNALFFATLSLVNIRSEAPVVLHYLRSRDALRGKKIINGLLIAQEAGVDVSIVDPKKLLPQLEGLGD